ncbi:MAG: o-succinylbenzoate--CoA ligase [Anaerolineae bacterium]
MHDWLSHRAMVSPEKAALRFGGRTWSYTDLQQQVSRMCSRLAAAGFRRGQHVALLMPNRPEFVFVIHALARLGVVLVPLNVRLTPAELRWQVRQSDCHWLLCDRTTEAAAVQLELAPSQVVSVDRPASGQVLPLNRFPDADPENWQQRPLNLAATQGIIFTSGTTGQPKGAMLSFGNHFYSATASAFRLGMMPDDGWLACMPLYHVGGLAVVLRCCLYGIMLDLHPRFDPDAVLLSIRTATVTHISVVPTMLARLLDMGLDEFSRGCSLRCVLVGGAALTEPLLGLASSINLPIASTYGLTEAASQVATTYLTSNPASPGSVGKPLLFTAVQVVNEAGTPVPAGEIGEIAVSGPTVMQGYYNQPQATARALRDGTLFTGDLGYLDADGDLWVVQRRADLIVTGGENVYPAEVEAVLRRHPAVADACVAGIPDAEWGQRVGALVQLLPQSTASHRQLTDFCRQYLAGYKIPRYFQLVDTLPLTASGKVQRDAVQRQLSQAAQFGAAD